jgi:hypothetical protein
MEFFDVIDSDRFINAIYSDIEQAIREWHDGGFQDETSFCHDATRILNRRRRRCDVGKFEKVTVKSDLHVLHRKGSGQSDRFGSDVAVTVALTVNSIEQFRKAVFFQVKRSRAYSCRLEGSQLQDALALPLVKDRAFALVVDEQQPIIRVRKITDIVEELGDAWPRQDTYTVNCNQWDGFTVWLYQWVRCEVGAASDAIEQRSIRRLLTNNIMRGPTATETMDDIQMAKEWIDFRFNTNLSKDQLDLGDFKD